MPIEEQMFRQSAMRFASVVTMPLGAPEEPGCRYPYRRPDVNLRA